MLRADKLRDIARMLRRQRKACGLGVRETARLIKVSPTTITNVENGKDFRVSILLDLMGIYSTAGREALDAEDS